MKGPSLKMVPVWMVGITKSTTRSQRERETGETGFLGRYYHNDPIGLTSQRFLKYFSIPLPSDQALNHNGPVGGYKPNSNYNTFIKGKLLFKKGPSHCLVLLHL
jgi:hypothetical protein